MSKIRNILFIMCDQLRADYLGCNGHPSIRTKNIDWLASQGVNFTRAYAQSPVCGPSRMSFYTGRYVSSHGATWNKSPIRADELTMGQAMTDLGLRSALIGKSHIVVDPETLAHFGTDTTTPEGRRLAEGGFEPIERDDGVHRDARVAPDLAYNAYLRSHGYDGPNPWHSHANSAEEGGKVLSGWYLRHANKPARVAEEHSETAYMTDRALAFIEDQGDAPWFLHLSYIKPHWPYMAPAPYHALYGPEDVQPVLRDPGEKAAPHPIAKVLMGLPDGAAFQQERTRQTVIPTYMGLIHQIDDHLGRVFDLLRRTGRMEDTLIVFTSDHGDHLGDHWLADKGMFYEQALRVPLIIYDPRAEATRGRQCEALTQAVDLLPTFIEALGGEILTHRLEGQSLCPALAGNALSREAVFSELDYAFIETRRALGMDPNRAMGRMVRTEDWKYIRFDGLPPQLYDLRNDPGELRDLGTDPAYASVRAEMAERLATWSLGLKSRVTMPEAKVTSWLDKALAAGASKSAW